MGAVAARVNSLEPQGSIGCDAGATSIDLRVLLREAIADTHTPLKVVAACWGVHPSIVTRMLADADTYERRPSVPLDKFPLLPDDIERAFATRYSQALGLLVQDVTQSEIIVGRLLSAIGEALPVLRAFESKRKMARASLETE